MSTSAWLVPLLLIVVSVILGIIVYFSTRDSPAEMESHTELSPELLNVYTSQAALSTLQGERSNVPITTTNSSISTVLKEFAESYRNNVFPVSDATSFVDDGVRFSVTFDSPSAEISHAYPVYASMKLTKSWYFEITFEYINDVPNETFAVIGIMLQQDAARPLAATDKVNFGEYASKSLGGGGIHLQLDNGFNQTCVGFVDQIGGTRSQIGMFPKQPSGFCLGFWLDPVTKQIHTGNDTFTAASPELVWPVDMPYTHEHVSHWAMINSNGNGSSLTLDYNIGQRPFIYTDRAFQKQVLGGMG
jgi:hypothetical protein